MFGGEASDRVGSEVFARGLSFRPNHRRTSCTEALCVIGGTAIGPYRSGDGKRRNDLEAFPLLGPGHIVTLVRWILP